MWWVQERAHVCRGMMIYKCHSCTRSVHMHVLTPTQLIAKAEAREKERQKAEERKVQSTFSVLQACY